MDASAARWEGQELCVSGREEGWYDLSGTRPNTQIPATQVQHQVDRWEASKEKMRGRAWTE